MVTSFTYLGIKEKAVKVNEFTEIKDSPPTLLGPLYLMFRLHGDLFLLLDYFFRMVPWGRITGPRGQSPFRDLSNCCHIAF